MRFSSVLLGRGVTASDLEFYQNTVLSALEKKEVKMTHWVWEECARALTYLTTPTVLFTSELHGKYSVSIDGSCIKDEFMFRDVVKAAGFLWWLIDADTINLIGVADMMTRYSNEELCEMFDNETLTLHDVLDKLHANGIDTSQLPTSPETCLIPNIDASLFNKLSEVKKYNCTEEQLDVVDSMLCYYW